MQKGKVNGALKLLTNNMSNGILPLTDETLLRTHLLRTKHPEMQNAHEEVLLQEPIKQVHPIIYEAIDKALISKAALKMKGGWRPSGFDAKNWRRILVSKSFVSYSLDLRKLFANFIRTLFIRNSNTSTNNIMDIANKDVQQAAGSLQVHTGQDAGQGKTEAKLLGDAEHAFNAIK